MNQSTLQRSKASVQPTRYHPALIALHWLLALLLLVSLTMGTFVLDPIPETSPEKIDALRGHMIAGALILLLTLVRLATRAFTSHPPKVSTGSPVVDSLAPLTHRILYFFVIFMAGSGLVMAFETNLLAVVFGGQGTLPSSFDGLSARAVHGFIAKALMVMIGLHIAAAFYHQFVRKDGLFRRMWFGKRFP